MEEQLVPFGFYHLLGTIFCIGLDAGVTIAVGVLLYYQVCLIVASLTGKPATMKNNNFRYRGFAQARDIVRNQSSIEGWIVEKVWWIYMKSKSQ